MGTHPARKAEGKMNKAAIACKLHEIADDYMFGTAKWPMEGGALATFSKMLKELGLEEDVPGTPGNIRSTTLGQEMCVGLINVFDGAHEIGEIPLILEWSGYLEEQEADELMSGPQDDVELRILPYVLRAYKRFCNRSGLLN
jgi:hypothetical protein